MAICQNPDCGREFTSPAPSRTAKGYGRYCSHTCHIKCNPPDTDKLHTEDVRKRRSLTKTTTPKTGHKEPFVCDACGQTFQAYASQRPKELKFCNRQCGFDFQRGKRPEGQADTEPVLTYSVKAPDMTVIYDPVRKELRNQ